MPLGRKEANVNWLGWVMVWLISKKSKVGLGLEKILRSGYVMEGP